MNRLPHSGCAVSSTPPHVRPPVRDRTTSERISYRSAFFAYHAEPLAILDESGRFVDVNPAFERAVGRRRAEVTGRGFLNVVPKDAHAKVRREFIEARKGGDPMSVETRFFPVDGPPRWLSWVFTPAQEGFVFVSGHDVTDRVELGRVKDEFVAMVSHELRTPMTSVSGSLGLVLGGVAGVLPERVQELIQIAFNNCQRLIRLVNDILDIEKIASGTMEMRRQCVDVAALAEKAVESTEAFATGYGVNIAIDFSRAPETVQGDADRLTQVLTNLLSNAVKFSPRGGEVSLVAQERGGVARFSVFDRGPGISESVRPVLFQRFVQGDSSDSRNTSGTGLGLSIVKAIVEQHDGEVGFRDRDGGGTEFFVDLPQTPADPASLIPVSPGDSFISASVLGRLPTQRVLLVESDEDLLRVLTEQLRTHAVVSSVTSVDEALRSLRQSEFDAVVVEPAVDIGDARGVVRALRAAAPSAMVFVYSEQPYPQSGPAVERALVKSEASPRMLTKALVTAAEARRGA